MNSLPTLAICEGRCYIPPMRDRIFFPLCILAAAAMVALALVWPQGMGAPSPAPFGHSVETRK